MNKIASLYGTAQSSSHDLRRVRTWPPKWLQTYGPGMTSVSGEAGVLDAVFLSQVLVNKVYLVMMTGEGNSHIGTLIFESASAAKAVFNVLRSHMNKRISIIGAIELPEKFGANCG